MIAVPIAPAALLCASPAPASYFHFLNAESLRLHPREIVRSFTFFEHTLRPQRKLEQEALRLDGIRIEAPAGNGLRVRREQEQAQLPFSA